MWGICISTSFLYSSTASMSACFMLASSNSGKSRRKLVCTDSKLHSTRNACVIFRMIPLVDRSSRTVRYLHFCRFWMYLLDTLGIREICLVFVFVGVFSVSIGALVSSHRVLLYFELLSDVWFVCSYGSWRKVVLPLCILTFRVHSPSPWFFATSFSK